ncbi:hypothetical protein GGI43DRAFT_387781 [Trichoderma evansii]
MRPEFLADEESVTPSSNLLSTVRRHLHIKENRQRALIRAKFLAKSDNNLIALLFVIIASTRDQQSQAANHDGEHHDYDNRGPQLLRVNIAFGIVAVITVLLRTYTRVFVVKALGPDDWFMAAATIVWVAYYVSSSTGVYYGTGQHIVIVINIKASFAWFLLRIITNQVHKWIIYAATLFSVIPRIVFFFVALFQCQPVSYFWDRSQPGKCIPINIIISLVYFDSVMTIITDFTFAILPAFIIWSLEMKTQVKTLLVLLIAMGCIASAAVCVRLAYTHTLKNPDFLWATIDVAVRSTIEMGLAISAASLINNGGSHLDRNVYIMSDSKGRSFAKKDSEDWELGTHAAAYAEPRAFAQGMSEI